MPNIFNADNGAVSGSAGIKLSSDTSGVLNIQTNGTTAISISSSQVVSFPSTTSIGTLYFAAGTAAAPSISVTGDTNTGIYFPAADTIAFTEGGVESMRLTSTGQIAASTDGTASAPVFTRSSDLDTGQWFPTANTLAWSTGGSERMRINSSGNVGIGTSAPNAALTIGGGSPRISFFDGDPTYSVYRSSTTMALSSSGPILLAAGSGGTITFTNSAARMHITVGGNIGIGTIDPGATLDVAGNARSNAWIGRANVSAPTADAAVYRAADNTLAFSTANTEQARIDSAGNMGLGVTPSAWASGEKAFQIINTTFGGGIFASGSNVGTIVGANAYFSGTGYRRINAAATSIIQFAVGETRFLTAGSSTADSTITFTQAMTLDASGNLLVGTTAQYGSQKLSVNGGIAIDGRNATNPGLSEKSDDNTGIFWPAADTLGFTTNGTERARITSGGNFCIGNASASGRLQLGTSTASDNNSLVFNRGVKPSIGGTQAAILCEWNGIGTTESMTFMADAGYKFLDDTGNTEWARITSGGALLVGTTAFTQSGNRAFGAHWSYTGSGGEGGCEFRNTSTSSASDPNPCLILQKGSTTTSSDQRFIQFYANTTSQPMGGIVGNGATNVQFVSLSDARQKTNIQSISGSLEKILALNPVSFDWIKSGEHVKAGFVAQNVEQVFPEFVVENFDTENGEPRKGLTGGMTGGIIAHLVKAIQELKAELDALKGSN